MTHLLLFLSCALFLAPLLFLALGALESPAEQASPNLLPERPVWGNFVRAFTDADFSERLPTSLLLAGVYAALTTASSACAGYGLARFRAPGSRLVLVLLALTMMIPGVITLLPTYLLFAKLGLVGTYWPWVLWGLGGNSYIVLLFRQFFVSIPREQEESALLDGCGHLRVFWRVVLPQSRPALAASAVLTFAWAWGDWTAPLLLLDADTTTLAVALTTAYAHEPGHTADNLLAAGSLLYTLPVLALFLVAQRYLTAGAYAVRTG
ncbi:carbohydrate ABC transporter permease [Actinocorallia sp. API 0066]|uniref:carbohydrate ABC transporter permease n=1 Tax=Actinocorallia sp. API 0066 TaxID=2896846 RepID=UPI001E282FB4|nr:carbohydrate ABC transporter permease [Actinocorallia sp. API 0066]MCD0452677.1 carbohydrate ABC transporter permease [Actinocorallia sp. API 0066]